MYFTGFADEASTNLEGQIKATQALGWSNIESRNIDGVNIHNLSEEQFEKAVEQLKVAKVQINCFGSSVANWGKDPTVEADVKLSLEELTRALKRMQILGTRLLRGMSYKIMKQLSPHDKSIEKLVIKNVKELVRRCEDAGVIFLHENCMNFGGQSHEHTLKLIEGINSPNFKLVFDTGNPPFSDLRLGEGPYRKQNSWDFYKNVREHIHYIHIKDAIFQSEQEGIFPKSKFTWPGEGQGDVKKIVKDLLQNGYDGGFSMEPHIEIVFHDQNNDNKESQKSATYIEYGRRFMKLVEDCKSELTKP
jgi:sugar phosphate isomerase/epimerase